MNSKLKNVTNWLLPALLILFLLEVLLFPLAVGQTYAGRSENPDHVLTYQPGKLTWSKVTGIDENGAAKLSLFDAVYENVKSDDGSAIIAPGTEGLHSIRLRNTSQSTVGVTAVLYAIKTSENLPVQVSLASNLADASPTGLPEGVEESQIIRCVSGNIAGGQQTDFDISWLWSYTVSDEQDLIDVDFGNKAANGKPDDITVGFYLVVEDGGTTIPPKTADRANLTLYITLMCITGAAMLLLLFAGKRSERKCGR